MYIIAIIFLAFFLFPIAWIFLESLKTTAQIYTTPPIIFPKSISVEAYLKVITDGLPYIITSTITAIGVMLLTILVGAPAAYSMARYNFGGKKFLLFILFIYSLPGEIFMLSIYKIISFLGLMNTWWALILTFPIFVLPVVIWMNYNFYKNFPPHIEEAAQMDGMNIGKTYFKIILPLSQDGIAVAVLYAFLMSWGALLFPLALAYSPFNMNFLAPSGALTFSVYIGGTIGHEASFYNLLGASSFISLIPSVIILYYMRDKLDKLYRVGGSKG